MATKARNIADAEQRFVNTNGDTMTGPLNLPVNGLTVGTDQLVLSGGNVGIGVAPQVPLQVAGDIHVSGGDRTIFNRSNNALSFGTNDTERMRIDSSGNLLVGTTNAFTDGSVNTGGSNAIMAARNNNVVMYLKRAGANGTVVSFIRGATTNPVGSIDVTTTATSYVTSSDYRLKHDIQPMTGALAKVAALKPCTYKWNADDSAGEGFIAHELQEVCPNAVTGEKDAVDAEGNPAYQGVDTSFLVATLVASIQELNAKVEAQAAEIAALKAA